MLPAELTVSGQLGLWDDGKAMNKGDSLRTLRPSLMREAVKVAKAEGVSLSRLIDVAVAEKISALRTKEYFVERAAKGDIKKALQVLKRAGKGNPAVPTRRRPCHREEASLSR